MTTQSISYVIKCTSVYYLTAITYKFIKTKLKLYIYNKIYLKKCKKRFLNKKKFKKYKKKNLFFIIKGYLLLFYFCYK
jgi:hypothetical protein